MKWLALALLLTGCAQDKVMHGIAGAGVAGFARAAGATPAQACGLAFAAGVAKEAYDARGHGTVEVADALVTGAAGCLLAQISGTWRW